MRDVPKHQAPFILELLFDFDFSAFHSVYKT